MTPEEKFDIAKQLVGHRFIDAEIRSLRIDGLPAVPKMKSAPEEYELILALVQAAIGAEAVKALVVEVWRHRDIRLYSEVIASQ